MVKYMGLLFKQSLTLAAAEDNQWVSKSVYKWFILNTGRKIVF